MKDTPTLEDAVDVIRRRGQVGRQQGGSAPPLIATPEGWLMIYRGVRHTAAGAMYRIGLALFASTSRRCVSPEANSWVFGPETSDERHVMWETSPFHAATRSADGDTIHLYYGAADTCIALATGQRRELLGWLAHSEQVCSSTD